MKKVILSFTIIILTIVTILCSFNAIRYKQKYLHAKTTISNLRQKVELLNQSEEYPIDKKLEKCTSVNFMTAGMNNCTYNAIDAWNKEILKYSTHITKYSDSNSTEEFNNTQRAWENYYNKEKIYLNNTIAQKDGDIHTTITIGYLYELTKQRALLLKNILTEIKQ